MVDGGENLMERFGLEITFIIILLVLSSFSNIHYPSLSIKSIPYYSIVLIPDVDLSTFHTWSFFCGYKGLSTKVFFFTEFIHANGRVNGIRASVKI